MQGTEAGFKKCILIFGKHGVAVTKIYFTVRIDHAAFDKIGEGSADENQSTGLAVTRGETRLKYEDGKLDKSAFLTDWRALKDTHGFSR